MHVNSPGLKAGSTCCACHAACCFKCISWDLWSPDFADMKLQGMLEQLQRKLEERSLRTTSCKKGRRRWQTASLWRNNRGSSACAPLLARQSTDDKVQMTSDQRWFYHFRGYRTSWQHLRILQFFSIFLS